MVYNFSRWKSRKVFDMGLTVSTGMLADYLEAGDDEAAEWIRNDIRVINEILKAHNLPAHEESESVPEMETQLEIDGCPYSAVHYLRRFYAHVVKNPAWVPTRVPSGEDASDDPVLDDEELVVGSHLLCHSDCEGYYVPLEFDEVLITEDLLEEAAGMIGSSYRLKSELELVAPKLGISLANGDLSPEEGARLNDEICSDEGEFVTEKHVWLMLYECARFSIEHKTLIVFN